jgi:hypothetical protein
VLIASNGQCLNADLSTCENIHAYIQHEIYYLFLYGLTEEKKSEKMIKWTLLNVGILFLLLQS